MKSNKVTVKRKESRNTTKPILRPRTAYNFFYMYYSDILLKERLQTIDDKLELSSDKSISGNLIEIQAKGKTHAQFSLKQLTKIIPKRWKEVSPETREKFKNIAEMDKVRYTNAIMPDLKPQQKSAVPNFHLPQLLDEDLTRLQQENMNNVKNTRASEKAESSAALDSQSSPSKIGVSNGSEYTDTFGITWSEDELNFLKSV